MRRTSYLFSNDTTGNWLDAMRIGRRYAYIATLSCSLFISTAGFLWIYMTSREFICLSPPRLWFDSRCIVCNLKFHLSFPCDWSVALVVFALQRLILQLPGPQAPQLKTNVLMKLLISDWAYFTLPYLLHHSLPGSYLASPCISLLCFVSPKLTLPYFYLILSCLT